MSSSSSSSSEYGIQDIKELKKLPKNDEALKLLQKLSSYVFPLCKQRKYRVSSLSEFNPTKVGLLGMNVNRKKILIRLRDPHDINQFYSWDFVLGTLIHELTHMEIGEHSAAFYKLMDELHDEVEKLQNDATKLGMSHNFNTLGGGKVNKDRATIEAGKAAIKRFQNPLKGSGVNILGGSSSNKLPTKEELRRLAADAADRRMNDNKWCPNEISNEKSKDNTIVYIQCPLCEVFNESTLLKCHVCDTILPTNTNTNTNTQNTTKQHNLSSFSSRSTAVVGTDKKRKQEIIDLIDSPQKLQCLPCSDNKAWECSACTYINEQLNNHFCELCNTEQK